MFRRRNSQPPPEPQEVKAPTFIMNGETIVEVTYTQWKSYDGGDNWNLSEGFDNLELTDQVDGVVYELPSGCFYSKFPANIRRPEYLQKGDTYSINIFPTPGDTGNLKLVPCTLTARRFKQENLDTSSIESEVSETEILS